MYCPKCGTKNKDGAKYCSNCGASLGKRPIGSFSEAVELAKAGDERGFSYLYEETYKSKYYLALKYMDSKEAAEDVLQDAYIKAFSKLDTLKDPETFPTWLGTIVANTAKNALQKKNPVLFTDLPSGDEESDLPEYDVEDESIDYQPEEAYTRQETSELVQEMIGSLSEEQKMCILMYHIDGESIHDIAEALDCSENTVKSRLNYGRKNLKAKAEELQKKGYKLFTLAPIPLLLFLFRKDAYAMSSEQSFLAAGSKMEGVVLRNIPLLAKETAAQTVAKAAAGAAHHGFLASTAGKVILTVIIAGGAAGGAVGGMAVYHNNHAAEETIFAEAEAEAETAASEVTETSDSEAAETDMAPAEEAVEEEETVEEDEVIIVSDDMYPELLEGGLTKEQFEIALAYAPETMENGEISAEELIYIVEDISYDFPEVCFDGTWSDGELSDEGWFYYSYYTYNLSVINNFLSVLTDYQLSEADTPGWDFRDGISIEGDIVRVSLFDGEWMTPHAEITDAVLADDTLTVTYNVRATGSGIFYPESTSTRTAVLEPAADGRYRVDSIFLGTAEEPYDVLRQEVLVTYDDGGYRQDRLYYDLVSVRETDDAHRAINAALNADYQDYRTFDERTTGHTIEEVIASDTIFEYHYDGAGVTNIEDGILSVRFRHTMMGEVDGTWEYGLTFSLETGEQLSISDLTDMSDEDLLAEIKTVLREYFSDWAYIDQNEVASKINAYTLDDIGSGLYFMDTCKLSFFVDAGEIYILIPPLEMFTDIWSNYAIPTGIYIS